MRSGTMPSRIHHTASVDKRPSPGPPTADRCHCESDRQAILGKGALEPRARDGERVRRQRITPQHIPTESVAERERIAGPGDRR